MSDPDFERLTGPRKAAALMIALGAERAAQILRTMKEPEVEAITREILKIERLPAAVKERILAQVYEETASRQPATSGGADFVRDLLGRTLPSKKAAELLARTTAPRADKPFGFMVPMDPALVGQVLASEHPQTMALVLSNLPPDAAGRIVMTLPADLRADVTTRLAVIGPTDPVRVRDVEAVLRRKLETMDQSHLKKAGGIDHVVGMLGAMDSRSERALLDALADKDPLLAEQIRQNLFGFEDIRLLDDRSIRRLLLDVRRELPTALRTASEELKQRIFDNMSSRARAELQQEMALRGPLRVRDIEDSQQRIVDTALALAEKEEIHIARGREDVFL